MKKYFLSIGVALAASLSFTSCLESDNNEQTYTFNYGSSDCFNRVLDSETGEYYIGLNPTYSLKMNMTAQTVSIDMSNVKLSSDLNSGFSFRIPELPLKINSSDAFYVASGTNLTPVGQISSNFMFNSFDLHFSPFRAFGTASIPVYNINYTVNNRYVVTTYPTSPVYFGSISAVKTNAEESENAMYSVTNDVETYYQIVINPEKMTAKLLVYGAKYSEKMKRYNFYVEDLPVVLIEGGYRINTEIDKDYKIKNNSNVVEEKMSIRNISVLATLKSGATISFDSDLDEYGKYDVTASLRYLLYDNSSNKQ